MTNKKQKFYLLKSKEYSDSYMQAEKCGVYSSDIGTAIHTQLPPYIPKKGDLDTEVISSDTQEFWEILKEELIGTENSMGLEEQIQDAEWKLGIMKKNRDIIKRVLGKEKI
jgi:hypothetical protein